MLHEAARPWASRRASLPAGTLGRARLGLSTSEIMHTRCAAHWPCSNRKMTNPALTISTSRSLMCSSRPKTWTTTSASRIRSRVINMLCYETYHSSYIIYHTLRNVYINARICIEQHVTVTTFNESWYAWVYYGFYHNVYIHVCIYCLYVCVYVCVYVLYVYIYIYIYI